MTLLTWLPVLLGYLILCDIGPGRGMTQQLVCVWLGVETISCEAIWQFAGAVVLCTNVPSKGVWGHAPPENFECLT